MSHDIKHITHSRKLTTQLYKTQSVRDINLKVATYMKPEHKFLRQWQDSLRILSNFITSVFENHTVSDSVLSLLPYLESNSTQEMKKAGFVTLINNTQPISEMYKVIQI
jgi:hypothetical protein